MKSKSSEFGQRLKKLRQARGLTQEELAGLIGATQRTVEYYENQSKFPPITYIPAIVKALKVSADELLGIKPCDEAERAEIKNLMKRVKLIREFPLRDQRTIFSMINNIRAKHTLKSQSKNGTN